jgi:hypothetical protein
MSRAAEFIRDELDAYRDSSARAATSPSERGDLADWVQLGLAHLQMIRDQELRWAADTSGGDTDRDAARRHEIAALYERWTRSCEPLLQQIRQLQQAGERIEGGTELSLAYQEIRGVLSIPPDRVIGALKHLDQGRFRTTAEIRDELRRKMGA